MQKNKEEKTNQQDIHFSLEDVAESAPGLILVVDKQYTVCYVNRVTDGFIREDIIGSCIFDSMHPKDHQRHKEAVDKTFKTEEVQNLETLIQTPDYGEKWFSSQIGPVKINGEVNHIIMHSSDVDHLKEVENSLRLSEQKLKIITDNAPDIIMVVNKDFTLTYVNHTPEGITKEEIIGKSILEYIEQSFVDIAKEKINKVFRYGGTESYEVRGVGPNRTTSWYQSTVNAILDEGETTSVIISTRDITNQKELELQNKEFNIRLEEMVQERTEQLEKANKEIKVLLQEMHHRVKNNLQIISSLLNIQSSFVDDEEIAHILKISQDRIRTMALIHESLYKTDSLSEIKIKDYLDLLISDRVMQNESSKKIKFITKSPDVSFNIETMIPLSLTINELVVNSVKHAFPDNRKGEIAAEIVKLTDDKYKFIYKDDGVGFPDDFSLETTQTLGLELVDCFVGQLEGEFEFSSSKDKGVCYAITFDVNN